MVTCAPEKPKAPELGQIGISLERATERVAQIRAVLDGRPLPPEARKRANDFAVKARDLAAELDALADDRRARAQLEAREKAARRRRKPTPGSVWCDVHGRVRDERGVCVACGVPDVGRGSTRRRTS